MNHVSPQQAQSQPKLKRSVTLSQMVLYGLGVTIGAGVYVLMGQVAGHAGVHAPVSFILAAIIVSFSAASFGELSSRFPVSAGEAAYVEAGLGSKYLPTIVGLSVILVGITSAATVSLGATGYIRQFIDLPAGIIVSLLVISLGLVSVWGITQSVTLAAICALIEIGGLLIIVAFGWWSTPDFLEKIPTVIFPKPDTAVYSGIIAAGLLAFFAFIGFEDMVNIAEEVKSPEKTLPRAISLTLIISTIIYVLVATIAVLSGPIEELAGSTAPLTLVFQRVSNGPPILMSMIAIVAGLNGIIVQIIMAARVLYGLANKDRAPKLFATIHPVTQTPVLATALVVILVLVLTLAFPIKELAETTSRITLGIFALANLSLLVMKIKQVEAPDNAFTVWTVVPALGFLLSVCVLIASSL